MNSTIFFSVCSLFYCLMLIFISFSKNESISNKNRIFRILVTSNMFGLLLEVAGMFLGSNYKNYQVLNAIVLRTMLVYFIVWVSMFVIYVMNISDKKDKKIKGYKKIICLVMLIACCLVIFLPLYYNVKNGVIMYTSGPAVQIVYTYSLICEIVCLFIMFKNIKNIKASNYVSLFALVSLGTLVFTIQSAKPELILSTSMQTFVTYLVYFTMKKETNKKVEDK